MMRGQWEVDIQCPRPVSATAIDCSIVEAISKIDGVIDERNLVSPAKLGWNRASRTDAGVHAIGNLISCKVRRPRS